MASIWSAPRPLRPLQRQQPPQLRSLSITKNQHQITKSVNWNGAGMELEAFFYNFNRNSKNYNWYRDAQRILWNM
ncbi:hypothetical protein ACLKA7_008265 [Drosophila subpalustris]